MALIIKAEKKNIKDVFYNHKVYVVPAYQRCYVWNYDECFQMYRDITQAFRKRETYFLGNVIFAKDEGDEEELQIIDGQQRLTTIWLWLKTISVLLPNEAHYKKMLEVELWNKNSGIHSKIMSEVFENDDKGSMDYILQMTIDDIKDEYEKNKKTHKQTLQKKDRIIACFFYIYDWLKEFFDRVEEEKRKEFATYFINEICLLHIEILGKDMQEANEKAMTIFETMNNRGKSLTDTDIFKARLYNKAQSVDEVSLFKEKWQDLSEIAKSHALEIIDLFRYYYHIVRGENRIVVNETSLRDFFLDKDSPLMNLDYMEILLRLGHIAEVIDKLDKAKYSQCKVAMWLQILELYSNKYPMYAIVAYVYKNGFNEEPLTQFLQSLTRLCYHVGAFSYSIKYHIYNIIVSIMSGLEYKETEYEDVSMDFFDEVGRLKRGYVLLAHYLKFSNHIFVKYIFRKIFNSDDEQYNFLKTNTEEKQRLYESLGNIYVQPYETSSNISLYENIPTDINKKRQYVFNRELEIKKTLADFLNKKIKI